MRNLASRFKEDPFRLLLAAALILILFFLTFASVRVSQTNSTQWEYLIVSFGKVYFTQPLEDGFETRAKTANTDTFGGEAIATQDSLDALGSAGWELVDVVGQIGGDQEFVFKRPR
ncbi:MAG: hypothetical protein U5L04_17130 [Trueperaceae bacterium]|nr:hypothetical protein [Trueperaceae bacterium]